MSEARAYEPNVTRVRTVTVIPPRMKPVSGLPALSVRPKRVAAYARVSTNSEEQLTSYDAQVKHYTEHIKARERSDNWQFVEVYTDKGITGISTKKREGFNRMIYLLEEVDMRCQQLEERIKEEEKKGNDTTKLNVAYAAVAKELRQYYQLVAEETV